MVRKLKIPILILLVVVVNFLVVGNKVEAVSRCQGYAIASYGGGNVGSGIGWCSFVGPNSSKIQVEVRNCATNATVSGTPKTTFCGTNQNCSGSSNTFTRITGQTYYTYVTYTPNTADPNWAFVDTSDCR